MDRQNAASPLESTPWIEIRGGRTGFRGVPFPVAGC